MPKAGEVLAALQRDGWVELRRKETHRSLAKGDRRATWAWHDGNDLGAA
jgi:predicted RNA binding protein YcfA (HicA-like mRNA interferase family)